MTNLAKLIESVNEIANESTPHGIEHFNIELKFSFDKESKMWTGQIRNEGGIAFNCDGDDLIVSDKYIETVIDKLSELLAADF